MSAVVFLRTAFVGMEGSGRKGLSLLRLQFKSEKVVAKGLSLCALNMSQACCHADEKFFWSCLKVGLDGFS